MNSFELNNIYIYALRTFFVHNTYINFVLSSALFVLYKEIRIV